MILNKHSLVDSIQYLHGQYKCSTYARGTKCIDYIFISTDILPALKRGGIPPIESVISSDHRAVFIDVHIQSCLDSDLSCLLRPPQHSLHSTHQRNRSLYVSNLYAALQQHKIFDRISRLQVLDYAKDPQQAEQLAEAIDRDVTRLMLASENKLRKPSPVPFSSNLAQACLKVSILKAKYISLKYGTNKELTISRYGTRLLQPFVIPSTIEQVWQLLTTTRKEVRTIRQNAISE